MKGLLCRRRRLLLTYADLRSLLGAHGRRREERSKKRGAPNVLLSQRCDWRIGFSPVRLQKGSRVGSREP